MSDLISGGVSGHPDAPPAVPLHRIVKRFWPYARPHRGLMAAALLGSVLSPLMSAATIALTARLVDDVLVPADLPALGRFAVLFGAVALGSEAVASFTAWFGALAGERFIRDLRRHAYGRMQQHSPAFVDARPLGDMITRMTSDVSDLERLIISGSFRTVSSALKIIFFGGALFWMNWRLALVAAAALPLFLLISKAFGSPIQQASRDRRRHSGRLAAVIEENLANTALVQAYNDQFRQQFRFDRENVGRYLAGLRSARLQNVYAPAITAVELVGTLVVLAVGVSELARGRLSLGELIAFGAFLEALFSPVRRLAGTITDIAAAGAGAERLIDLLDGPEPHTVRVGRRRPDLLVPLLELDRVGFDYPDGTPVLRDLDLVVRPGEVVAVNGPSGIGKSTLIKILLRFYDPTRGQVRLGGFDLTELDAEYVRQATAVVWQDPLCFDTSIADNVRIGRPDAEDPEVWRALRAADLDGFVAGLPDGLHSPVGQRGRRLSGGQLRRLGLARALVREAPVLIMDEPTAGLDAATADRILQAVRRSSAGRATLVVTHDPAVLGWADRVITVDRIRQQEPVR